MVNIVAYQLLSNSALLLFLFTWPQVREVCPKYEVVMLQPRIGTPIDLGSAANCYVAIRIIPAPPARHPMSYQGGYPLMPLPFLPCQPPCPHTGSYSALYEHRCL